MAQFPHCDDLVLHRPGTCEFCDMYPELQHARINSNINFTGENIPSRAPCPAEVRRPLDIINQWHGNVPSLPKT